LGISWNPLRSAAGNARELLILAQEMHAAASAQQPAFSGPLSVVSFHCSVLEDAKRACPRLFSIFSFPFSASVIGGAGAA
jgi:hypothetical protein